MLLPSSHPTTSDSPTTPLHCDLGLLSRLIALSGLIPFLLARERRDERCTSNDDRETGEREQDQVWGEGGSDGEEGHGKGDGWCWSEGNQEDGEVRSS